MTENELARPWMATSEKWMLMFLGCTLLAGMALALLSARYDMEHSEPPINYDAWRLWSWLGEMGAGVSLLAITIIVFVLARWTMKWNQLR